MTPDANKKQKEADRPIRKLISKKTEVIVQTKMVLEEKAIHLKKENMEARYLKIQPLYRYQTSKKIVPELRLCGNWLAAAGFDINSYVAVTVMDGLLVIRMAKVEDNTEGSAG